jgi:hypothetical protein
LQCPSSSNKKEQVNPLEVQWKYNSTSNIIPNTSIEHYTSTITSVLPNGAYAMVVAESWSQDISRPFGPYVNNVSADSMEV